MTGPTAGARAVGMTRMADARTRSAGGNARNSMVRNCRPMVAGATLTIVWSITAMNMAPA
jgi:hypothetical protein